MLYEVCIHAVMYSVFPMYWSFIYPCLEKGISKLRTGYSSSRTGVSTSRTGVSTSRTGYSNLNREGTILCYRENKCGIDSRCSNFARSLRFYNPVLEFENPVLEFEYPVLELETPFEARIYETRNMYEVVRSTIKVTLPLSYGTSYHFVPRMYVPHTS